MNEQMWSAWVRRVGGPKDASLLILDKLECSLSKAEKLAYGRYPSLPTKSEQTDLADLVMTTRDSLFPLVRARGARAS